MGLWVGSGRAGHTLGCSLAPGIPHPHQLSSHHLQDVATGPLVVFLAVVSQRSSARRATKKKGTISGRAPYSCTARAAAAHWARLPQAPGMELGVSMQRGPPEGLHLGGSPALPLQTTAGSLHARAVQLGVSKRRLGEGHRLQRAERAATQSPSPRSSAGAAAAVPEGHSPASLSAW